MNTILFIKKYEYVGKHQTRVKTSPYSKPIDVKPGDVITSQQILPSRFFKEMDISIDEAILNVGESDGKGDEEEEKNLRDSISKKEVIKLIKEQNIEIPEGTKNKNDLVALAEANGIQPPDQQTE